MQKHLLRRVLFYAFKPVTQLLETFNAIVA